MLYRVVFQGRAVKGMDTVEVRREFMRVTGLSESVTEHLFTGMPKVLKRQVSEADAERISQTLRAIGAVVTVERELAPVPGVRAAGVTPLTTPTVAPAVTPPLIDGMPTEVAASAAPSRKRPSRRTVIAGVLLVLLAVLAAPAYEDLVLRLRNKPKDVPTAPVRKATADSEPAPEAPVFNPAALHGSWRCTNQTTGVSTYWVYLPDGALVYQGDDLKHGERAITGPDFPVRWTLDPEWLTWDFEAKPPLRFVLLELSPARLYYRDPKADVTRCQR